MAKVKHNQKQGKKAIASNSRGKNNTDITGVDAIEQEIREKKARDKLIPLPVSVSNEVKNSCLFNSSVRCGDCMHLSHIAHPEYGNVCKDKGITELNRPCRNFSPDIWSIGANDEDFTALAKTLQKVPTNKLGLFVSLLNKEVATRRSKLSMGMKVYVNVFRSDYLSNYFEARVFFASKNKVYLYCNINNSGSIAVLGQSSVITEAKYLSLRKQLLAEDRDIDPMFKNYFTVDKEKIIKKAQAASKRGKAMTIEDIANKTPVIKVKTRKGRSNKRFVPVDIALRGGASSKDVGSFSSTANRRHTD